MTPVNRTGLQGADSVKGELVNKGLEDKVWAADGGVTLEMAERMLKWHAEAVGRVMELSAGDVYVSSKSSGVKSLTRGVVGKTPWRYRRFWRKQLADLSSKPLLTRRSLVNKLYYNLELMFV